MSNYLLLPPDLLSDEPPLPPSLFDEDESPAELPLLFESLFDDELPPWAFIFVSLFLSCVIQGYY